MGNDAEECISLGETSSNRNTYNFEDEGDLMLMVKRVLVDVVLLYIW